MRKNPLLTIIKELVQQAEKAHPGTQQLFENGSLHLEITHKNYDLLIIDTQAPMPSYEDDEKLRVTISHRYTLNGIFMVYPAIAMTEQGAPIRMWFSMYDEGETVARSKDTRGNTLINRYQEEEILAFGREWARSLREQGFVDAALESSVVTNYKTGKRLV